ncbi:uncharacterized protein LOC110457985 [Mizuhopecten yessoensis]|uniref:uncharacterized protein LOC110457985 n=1 Tax=Mizuhopecten yessoensis TaxID=6573 RepID=UPI000B45B778|nr:uncharacterized protein LOC110457985 [Mizuhopecten yessoensis]
MNDDITFYLNRRGTRKTTFRGYDYCKDREYKEKMYWKCTNRLCGGRIITLEHIVVKETEHSLHGPDHGEVKKNLSMARAILDLPMSSRLTAPDYRIDRSVIGQKYCNNVVVVKGEQNKRDELMDVGNDTTNNGKQRIRDLSKKMCHPLNVKHSNTVCTSGLEELDYGVLKHTNCADMLGTEAEFCTNPSTLCYGDSDTELRHVNQNNYGNRPIAIESGEQNERLSCISEQGASDRHSQEERDDYAEFNDLNTDSIQELHQADLQIRLCMAMFRLRENTDLTLENSIPDFSQKYGTFNPQRQSRNTRLDEEESKFLHDLLKYLDGLPK